MGPRTKFRCARKRYGKGFLGFAFSTAPTLAFWTMALSRLFNQSRQALPLSYDSPSADRWCDVHGFVPAGIVSSTPHLCRSSKTQTTCDGCFARQSICSAISLDSLMSTTASERVIVSILRWWLLSIGTRQSRRPSSHCVRANSLNLWDDGIQCGLTVSPQSSGERV